MTSQAAAGQSVGVHFARFCAYICIAILMYTRAAVAEAEGNANGGGECKRVYIHTHIQCVQKSSSIAALQLLQALKLQKSEENLWPFFKATR